MKLTMTTDEVAKQLNCSVKFVRNMRKSGLLSGIKLGRGYLYALAEIGELLTFLKGKSIDSYADMCLLAEERKNRQARRKRT